MIAHYTLNVHAKKSEIVVCSYAGEGRGGKIIITGVNFISTYKFSSLVIPRAK
jgi:hypothetical protein